MWPPSRKAGCTLTHTHTIYLSIYTYLLSSTMWPPSRKAGCTLAHTASGCSQVYWLLPTTFSLSKKWGELYWDSLKNNMHFLSTEFVILLIHLASWFFIKITAKPIASCLDFIWITLWEIHLTTEIFKSSLILVKRLTIWWLQAYVIPITKT